MAQCYHWPNFLKCIVTVVTKKMGFLKYNSVAKQSKKVTNEGSSSAWCEVFNKLSRLGP